MIATLMPAKRAQDEPQKVTLAGRVRPEIAKKLEAIADGMRPHPTISQLVALAVEEFVERHEEKTSTR